MKYTTLVFSLLLSTNFLYAQSPWTQEKGSGFGQLSLMAIPKYNEFFVKGSNDLYTSSREYSETAVQAYVEYGVIEGTTLVLDAPIKFLSAGEELLDSLGTTESGNLTSLGNTRFSVRQRIYNDGVAVAAQLGVEIPTGKYDDATGLRTGYGAWTFMPSVSVGGGLGKGYIFGYGGVGIRTNDYSNYFNIGLEGGYNPFDKFWAMLFFDVIQSFENGERLDPPNNQQTAFYVNNQEWASLGLKLLYNVNDNIGLTLSTTLAAFAANQVPASPSLSLGVFTEW